MADLFKSSSKGGGSYTAKDIEVLEGLEPVRRRPGMYIGGTDEKAMHHLIAEVLDNAMDEAVAGHASIIEVHLGEGNEVTIKDNGRGIPIDPHPKFKNKSALEVIMTTLHSGGKFSDKVYQTSGGSARRGCQRGECAVGPTDRGSLARAKPPGSRSSARGTPKGKLDEDRSIEPSRNKQSPSIPDPNKSSATKRRSSRATVYKMTRSKAYLFEGVRIKWSCDKALLKGVEGVPEQEEIHFPNGLTDYLAHATHRPQEGGRCGIPRVMRSPAKRTTVASNGPCAGPKTTKGFSGSYCNTVRHTRRRNTRTRVQDCFIALGLKAYAEMINNKKGQHRHRRGPVGR